MFKKLSFLSIVLILSFGAVYFILAFTEPTQAPPEGNVPPPLNIGSDRLITIDELANIIIRISGKRITKKHNRKAIQGVRGRNADLTLVKEILKWEPKITLEEGLKKTYKWIENQIPST